MPARSSIDSSVCVTPNFPSVRRMRLDALGAIGLDEAEHVITLLGERQQRLESNFTPTPEAHTRQSAPTLECAASVNSSCRVVGLELRE